MRVVFLLFILATLPQRAYAQSVTAGADFLFYGDNTEFANPFREGETILGTAGRVYLDFELSEAATLRAGFFGKGRYGSHRALEDAEPVIALELKRGTSKNPARSVAASLSSKSRYTRPAV